ncbi:MAG: pyridoxal phosphate-dependent aminotransferase [Azospirillaceae bacterium]
MDSHDLSDDTEFWLERIAPRAAAVRESQIVEIVNAGREMDRLIPLWVGEGTRPTPGFIQEAAIGALREGHTFYTYQRGIPALRQAVADYLGGITARTVGSDEVYITGSGMQAIVIACQTILEPGDDMLVLTPVWPNINEAIRLAGGTAREVSMAFDGERWSVDLDRLFEAVTPRTKGLFINTPGNPTGVVIERESQREILDFARARGLWIITDEVYARFVFDGRREAPSFLDLATPEDRLIQVNSFSKNWAMTGWRMGWLVGPPALGQVFENLIQYATSGVPRFLQQGAVAALTQGEDFVAETVAHSARGRALCVETLGRQNRVVYGVPDGAFYFYFAVEGEPDSRDLAFRLLRETAVGLAPGSAFGKGGERFLRLCFAADYDKLAEACDRLTTAIGRL